MHASSTAALAVIATAVTAAVGLSGTTTAPPIALTAGDGLTLVPGISVTPAPGWSVVNSGPGWVTLHNAFATAEMEIKIKPARGTDPVAVLQGDIGNLSNVSTTGLTNVGNLSAPDTKPLQGGNFQQEADIDYSADGSSRMGQIPVQGWFMELLNTSTHQSAFIVYSQNGDAPPQSDGEGGAIVDSLL